MRKNTLSTMKKLTAVALMGGALVAGAFAGINAAAGGGMDEAISVVVTDATTAKDSAISVVVTDSAVIDDEAAHVVKLR